MKLLKELQAFDGTHTEPLEQLAAGLEASESNFDTLAALAEHDDAKVRIAATWVLKHWLEQDAEFSPTQVKQLVRLLDIATDWGEQLHLLQMFSLLAIPKASAKRLSKTAAALMDSENKFVRAWSVSLLVALGGQHESIRAAAIEALHTAEADEAASMRARIRQLRKQHDWAREA